MVGHGGWPADGAEENGVEALELLEPIVRHHLAVLEVVVAMRPVEVGEFEVEAEFPHGGFQNPQALRHHFLADAVAGDDCDFVFHGALLRVMWILKASSLVVLEIFTIRRYVNPVDTNREHKTPAGRPAPVLCRGT